MVQWLSVLKSKTWFIKLSHWEYWSFNAVYLPISWYFLWLALRAGNFSFFSAANPCIRYGGFLSESKWDIYPLLPKAYTPFTAVIHKKNGIEALYIAGAAFSFPIICKPDTGSRGRGVAIIHSLAELSAYHQQCPADYLLQEKIDYPMEAGIFYVKMPGEETGVITGIVEKEFLTITGDGHNTIEALLMQNERFVLQLKTLKTILKNELQEVPAANEKRLLVPFGNHARGCRFIDSSHRINKQLTATIDGICRQVTDFYFGRLDIRFESWEALERGEKLSIIELNGSGSEPTHMYDSSYTIFKAWREIIRHWKLLYRVSILNHRKGHVYLSLQETKKMFAEDKASNLLLNTFQFIPPVESDRAVG